MVSVIILVVIYSFFGVRKLTVARVSTSIVCFVDTQHQPSEGM
jgi:hypothetical protein